MEAQAQLDQVLAEVQATQPAYVARIESPVPDLTVERPVLVRKHGVGRVNLVRVAVYALQAVDAIESARSFRRPGGFETNPTMKPWSHGGAATMALGFALGDLARGAIFRHSHKASNASDLAQIAVSVQSILQTEHMLRSTAP